jgi:rifampicin phosphotransferase
MGVEAMGDAGVVDLADAAGAAVDRVGAKAAALARLMVAGFAVPPGFVATEEVFTLPGLAFDAAIAAAAAAWGEGPFAVRSSAAAEDLAEASYAGLYETFLNVPAGELAAAMRRCHAAADASRVSVYRQSWGSGQAAGSRMAVLVQPMIPADAAGVAFTADPVTGERDRTVVTAVRGLGERLVDGQAVGDEWTVHAGRVQRRRVTEHAIDAALAGAVADLARRVEAHAGAPQDIEWAYAGGRLWLLQARPMTALPDPVTWNPPGHGVWQRNFRLGEWLPEPVTPLFGDWLLPCIETGFADGMRTTAGTTFAFPRAIVNGWFYATPTPAITPGRLLAAVVSTRGRLLSFMFGALVQPMRNPAAADTAVLAGLYRRWREQLLPAYRQLVDAAASEADTATPQRLISIVGEVGRTAGVHLWYLAIVGGAAWKMERALARFARRHLPEVLPDGVAVLLSGLPASTANPPPHAVTSIDWYHPTLGELNNTTAGTPPGSVQHTGETAAARRTAEDACQRALADRTRLLRRFTAMLAVTQRYAGIREEQARQLTLGWPLLRHAAHRLGERLQTAAVIDNTDDAYFLTLTELAAGLRDDPPRLSDTAQARRTAWRRQRRLAPPLSLGTTPRLLRAVLGGAQDAPPGASQDQVVGQPASPGRATGQVRVIHGLDEFDQFDTGEILVAPITTPAWTMLLARAAGVVTDGGTLAAHASLVAREYAIPAVVGTGDATHRLVTGQVVTVDGSAGTVTPTW